MNNAKIAVAVKFCGGDLNPFDGAALECALRTGSRDITAVTMAPESAIPRMKQLTRLGVRAVVLTDAAFAGADTLATARTLAAYIKTLSPDYVFCGRQSTDGDTAQVPPCLAAILGYGIVPSVMSINGKQVNLRGGESVGLTGKQVLTFERIAPLRFPSMRSACAAVQTVGNDVLRIPADKCGQRGSPTRVVKVFENTAGRRNCEFTDYSRLDDIIADALKKQRIRPEEYTGPVLRKVYYVKEAADVARAIAAEAEELPVDGKSAAEIAETIRSSGARMVLWPDSAEMRVMAPQVAGLTGAGLCADCTRLKTDGEKLYMIRPAAGGSVTAEIECRAPVTMATVRTACGSNDDVIFAVGRGAEHALPQIRAYAEKYGARLMCSRAAVDDGVMPYECQVGLTGVSVAPKVYVAIGISGAVQHMCAAERAGTVIAVNKDKNARIFDFADYGMVTEV